MSFLRLQPTQDDKHRIAVAEAQTFSKSLNRGPFTTKLAQVATITDDVNFFFRKSLFPNQIAPVGLRDGDVVIDKAPDKAIDHEISLHSTVAPQLPHVRSFNDHRHPAKPTNGRGKHAAVEEVRVQNLHLSLPQDPRKPKGRV